MIFLMLYIVPKFKEMFAAAGSDQFPMISQIVFGFSEFCLSSKFLLPNAVWGIFCAA